MAGQCAPWSKSERFNLRDHTPGALDTELLEKCCSDDLLVRHEAVRIEQCAANDRDEDNAEPTTEHLAQVANDSAASLGMDGQQMSIRKVQMRAVPESVRTIAPRFATICVTVTSLALKLYWFESIVG